MFSQVACLLQLFLLAGLSTAEHMGPELTNLTKLEVKYAHIYWKYNPTERMTPVGDVGQLVGPRLTNLGYRFLIPSAERLAGITYVGHAARLRLVLERARNGEALRVGALGGSITAGQGVGGGNFSYFQYFMDWLGAAMPPHHSSSAAGGGAAPAGETGTAEPGRRRTLNGWVNNAGGANDDSVNSNVRSSRVGRIRRGLRGNGHDMLGSQRRRNLLGKHSFLNGAVPGTMSGYISSCFKVHLIPDPDLVFMEFAVNDSPLSIWGERASPRRPLERLIRKVLNLPSKPAVILVNMFATLTSQGLYWQTAERDFMEFATYYSLPSVSLRAAVFPSAATSGAEAVSRGAIFNADVMHPGRGGHVVITELLITLCLELLNLNSAGMAAAAAATAAIATTETGASTALGTGGVATTTAAPMTLDEVASVAARPLPPPLFPGNHGASVETCYILDQLQALVQRPVEGWNWTDESRNKWGYVATEPGKTIRLKVNTHVAIESSSTEELKPIILEIAYLQSYRGMGTARLSCEAGCNCTSIVLDAYDPRPASLAVTVDIKVTQHPECMLELKSGTPSYKAIEATKNGAAEGINGFSSGWEGSSIGSLGYKFKLIGIVVGEDPGAPRGTVAYVRGNTADLSKLVQDLSAGEKLQKT